MEVLKWIMETTEPKARGIHLKMWERQRSQGLDHRNITLRVNEYAIVLSDMELLLWADDKKLTPLLSMTGGTTLQWGKGREMGGKELETVPDSAFLSMHSTAPCNFRRSLTISSVLTALLKQTNWTWFVMCSPPPHHHYVVSNSTPPPQILKNRMWACTWVSAGQSCSGCKVNMTPWGDFLIMNTKRMSALIRLCQYAELLTVHFPFFSSLLFHGFNLIQLCVDSLLLLFILGFIMWTISDWQLVGLIFSIQTWQDFIFIFILLFDLQKVINNQQSNMDGHF